MVDYGFSISPGEEAFIGVSPMGIHSDDDIKARHPFFFSMTVAYSDCHPTLYEVHGRAKPVLRGPNRTEPNMFPWRNHIQAVMETPWEALA